MNKLYESNDEGLERELWQVGVDYYLRIKNGKIPVWHKLYMDSAKSSNNSELEKERKQLIKGGSGQ